MENLQERRRNHKRGRKRPRSVSSSSENIDASVYSSSSRRHKSKRHKRYSSKHRTSKKDKDSRRHSNKPVSLAQNLSSTGNARSIPVQINISHTSQTIQETANSQRTSKPTVPASSPSFHAVPSTSFAHPAGSQLHVNTSPARVELGKQTHSETDTKKQMKKKDKNSNHSKHSGTTNMKSNLEDRSERPPPLEERSESELQCSICSELFVRATMLNCIHTFCKYCIEMWKSNKAECPLCRTPITSLCGISKFDSIIARITQATEETKKQRLELLKERDELEMNLCSQQRQSSPPQTPSPGFEMFLMMNSDSERDSVPNYDSDYVNDSNMVFTDLNGEDVYADYNYITDSDSNGGVENIPGYDDIDIATTESEDNENHDGDDFLIDFYGSASENEGVDVIDNYIFGSTGSTDSHSEHDENFNYDENVSNAGTDENHDPADGNGYEVGGSDIDNAYADSTQMVSENSDNNVDDEAYDDNEVESDNAYEVNTDSDNSNDNLEETYEHTEDGGEGNYEDNGSGNSDINVDDEPQDDNEDDADSEDNYNSNSVDAYDSVSDNNSGNAYDNYCDNDSDVHCDDEDYDYY